MKIKNKAYTITEILYIDFNEYVSFANSFLYDITLSEDVVQDVFLQLITSNSNHLLWVDTSGSSKSYIKKIIAVRCLSKKSQFYKKNIEYKKNKVLMDSNQMEYHIHKNKKTDLGYDKSKYNKIIEVIKKFNEYERNLFLLYYESDMTYNNLSKEIGIPKISIYNTIRKVKKTIKKILADK